VREYGRNEDFRRWLARCHLSLGNAERARDELEFLCRGGRARWYTVADLASLYEESGNLDGAWRSALEAARAQGEDSAKVGLWVTLARILRQRGQLEDAANHLGWCLALRRKEGWKTPPHLQDMRQDLAGYAPFDELDCDEWRRRAQAAWDPHRKPAPSPAAGPASGKTRKRGEVCQVQPGRAYAFIMCGSERVYVMLRDLPEASRKDGARVEFSLVTSFDARKGRDSERAAEVTALS